MKNALVVVLGLMLLAGAVHAGKPFDASKRATDVIRPIVDPHRHFYEGFEISVPPPGWWAITNNPFTWEADAGDPLEGFQCASCFYDETYTGPQDEWMGVDYVRGADDDSLFFYAMGSVYWAVTPYQNYNFYVTVEGDTLWNYYDNNNGATSWTWQLYGVPLTTWPVGDTLTIAFGYTGYDGAQASFDALAFGAPYGQEASCCPLVSVCDTLDFNVSGHGWSQEPCGGASVWAWGTSPNPPSTACDGVPVTYTLGTMAGARYPTLSGEAALVGPLAVTQDCHCLEICHYYQTEEGYDGGNVKLSTNGAVSWTLVYPSGGYDAILNSVSYPAACVTGEQAFSGDTGIFVTDCFDLTSFIGENVLVGFFFGSDSFATDDVGWYIKWLKLGTGTDTPVRPTSWGAIKAMYR
jgi:hypothetical protein